MVTDDSGSKQQDGKKNKKGAKEGANATRTVVCVGAGMLAAGATAVALQQLSGIHSVSQLELYGKPGVGPVLRALFAKSVRTVSLPDQGVRLAALPSPLLSGAFNSLASLNLSGSALADLPQGVSVLTKLAKLNLSRCELTEVPPAVGGLTSLIDLDLSRNKIVRVAPELGRLARLKYLNLMCNEIERLPEEIGGLASLYRLGLKSNRLVALPDGISGLTALVELFVTDNKLVTLPASFGQLASLVKLQASYNQLESLPPEMGSLPNLELMRVAVNCLAEVPDSFSGLEKLAWFSLAGNPACPPPLEPTHDIAATPDLSEVAVGGYLGEGASGEVFQSRWQGRDVAVKVFKSEVSPDGRAADEIAVALFVDHPNLTRVLARVEQPLALVKELVLGKPLADKPNFLSLLRCRWRHGLELRLRYVLRVAASTCRALRYLHANGVCHGDLYAHNLLVDEAGNAVLCDYGASFFYGAFSPLAWQPVEVRAFGLLLKDMVERLEASPATPEAAKHQLLVMVHACVFAPTPRRPSFDELCRDLEEMMQECK